MKVASPAALAGLLQARLAETGDPRRVVTLSELLVSILPYPIARGALDLAGKGEYDLALLGFLRRGDLVQVDPAVVAAVEQETENPEPSLDFASSLGDSLLRLRAGVADGAAVHAPDPSDREIAALDPPAAEPPEPPAAEPPDPPAAEPVALIDPTGLWTPVPDAAGVDEGPGPEQTPDLAAAVVSPPELDVATTDELDVAPIDDPGAVPPHEPDSTLVADPRVVTEPEPWVPDPTMAPACWQCSEPLPDRPIVFFCTQCGVSQDNRRCSECGDRVEAGWRFCSRCGTELSPS